MNFKIINGPNLSALGRREREHYGEINLPDLERYTQAKLDNHSIKTSWFQSECEGTLVNEILSIDDAAFNGLIINPGALSHCSLALLDALETVKVPVCECHLSQVHARGGIRQSLLTAKAATMIMSGLKKETYYIAAIALAERILNA